MLQHGWPRRLHSCRLRWTRENARAEVSRAEHGTQTKTSIQGRNFAMSSTVESTVSVPLTPMTSACSA